ncbi:uncharacterized protein FIBRA_08401 [Fibroporia radiculosa]|uniref:HAD-like protein n=1 Tax=Fibroporia radiculosa TaxID=599839 RepID=J4I2P6_9APHY|nr:uncharacterized protein FIBRA_08401 [Fibroporia radiculosa]CCM06162.1 predicted protein [Fibroporia radiculosa]
MASPHLKAVIFDVGGVVCKSPLLAIAAYEREQGLPDNYINCAISARGSHGAWQRFERGEMPLFPFYEAFGQQLSDTTVNNPCYADYCRRKSLACPKLPDKLAINGRELFGRMMRDSRSLDEAVVEAIRRIRGASGYLLLTTGLRPSLTRDPATRRWRVIALTNNFSSNASDMLAEAPPSAELYPGVTLQSELAFLGWEDGPTPPALRALFDDFCDSSTLGMRKPEPGFYLLACERNGIEPSHAVFLDDLGMNLKVAQSLGMETIHVPIGRSHSAIEQLERKLGIELTTERLRTLPKL